LKFPHSHQQARAYQIALLRDFKFYLAHQGVLPIQSLYFGGGTPSLCPELIEEVLGLAAPKLADDAEIGIELHPQDCGEDLFRWLNANGFTHVSLGIESLDSNLLDHLSRGYKPNGALSALDQAVDGGFECVDVNLIYGIPGQNSKDSVEDAVECMAHGADQISAYPLIAFEGTPLGKRYEAGRKKPNCFLSRMKTQREIARALAKNGFRRNSIWCFSRESRRPFTTVTRPDYRGFGAGAGSLSQGVFYFNTFNLAAYCAQARPHTALVLNASESMMRLHWLYWAAYRTVIDGSEYFRLFDRHLEVDYRWTLRLLNFFHFAKREGETWKLNDPGADWVHCLQSLYSLSFIDQLWKRCKLEAWPESVQLK